MELCYLCFIIQTSVQIIGLKHLTKLKKKNAGNEKLVKAIDALIDDFRKSRWTNKDEVLKDRKDGDCVHSDGYYFFDIHVHRTCVLIEYQPADPELDEDGNEKDEGIVGIHWVGSHDEYERTFKNNKPAIEKWLRSKGLIE